MRRAFHIRPQAVKDFRWRARTRPPASLRFRVLTAAMDWNTQPPGRTGMTRTLACSLLLAAWTGAALAQGPRPADLDATLRAAPAKYRGLQEGKNADYIPALAKVPSHLFGVALVTVDGDVHVMGDVEHPFSIQSISKVFTMAEVMQEHGAEAIEDSVGVDATGQVF